MVASAGEFILNLWQRKKQALFIRFISRGIERTIDPRTAGGGRLNTEAQDFAWVVNTYSPMLLRVAFVYLKNHGDAEDVAQEVLLTYWQKNPRFSAEAARKAWLYKSAVNRCKDRLRSFWYSKRAELPEDLSYLPPEASELLCCVLQLEEKYRIPLHLHYYEGYSLKEIGQILRLRPATVGSRLHRGKEKLKRMMGGNLDETL